MRDNKMLLTLVRRELLDNLMTFRFGAAVVILLLLVVANTVVLIKDYEGRLADYNTAVKNPPAGTPPGEQNLFRWNA